MSNTLRTYRWKVRLRAYVLFGSFHQYLCVLVTDKRTFLPPRRRSICGGERHTSKFVGKTLCCSTNNFKSCQSKALLRDKSEQHHLIILRIINSILLINSLLRWNKIFFEVRDYYFYRNILKVSDLFKWCHLKFL